MEFDNLVIGTWLDSRTEVLLGLSISEISTPGVHQAILSLKIYLYC